MHRKIRNAVIPFLILVLAGVACNILPGSRSSIDPDAIGTTAAETVAVAKSQEAVGLTEIAQLSSEMTETSENGQTSTPPDSTATSETESIEHSPTATSKPCNLASFITDVTIPDKTEIQVGQDFIKTWRFRNIGTCTWSSGYQLVFKSGDKMDGPDSKQLIPGTVAPDATIDISVDLGAPADPGTYKGFWEMRELGGETFALSTGPFWVEIKAIAPTATPDVLLPPPVAQIIAPVVASESGSVRKDGSVWSPRNVGDNNANIGSQAFLSFDISAVPAGATIIAVDIDFTDYDTLGNPFNLGCLRMYRQNYGPLDSGDYFSGSASDAVARWCNAGQLDTPLTGSDNMNEKLQSYVGTSRAKFRVQFNQYETNSNGVADMVRLGTDIELIITFTMP